MTTFLFWNLNRKSLQEAVVNLAHRHEVDILALAECQIEPADLLLRLNPVGKSDYFYIPGLPGRKVELFARFPPKYFTPIYAGDRLVISHLKLDDMMSILLAVAHFPSKRNWSEASQALSLVEFSESIRWAEQQVGHSRTVLVGDLNVNPFESGVVSASGLHAIASLAIVERRSRIVQGREYPFFYNPMWNFMGDVNLGPPGTFYYASAEPRVYFWNTFDQVLIRPELLTAFKNQDLQILVEDGTQSFLTRRGLPDTRQVSDHLPLLFKLSL